MNPYHALDLHNSPMITRSKLEAAWESFNFREDAGFEVRPLIVESWKRCQMQGIQPLQINLPTPVSTEYIQHSMSDNPLIYEQDQILSGMKDLAQDSGHLAVITDANGTILRIDGDVKLRMKAEQMQFVTGSSWAEGHAGTNAIGVALFNRSPVQIFAAEHFCKDVHNWTCSASPIRDPATNQILGVLDLTGPWEVAHPSLLPAVVSAVRAIEERLRYKLEFQRAKVMEFCMNEMYRGRNTMIVALDRGYNVIKASPKIYEQGWIDTNHRLVGCPVGEPHITALERIWEVDREDGKWGFVLRTCLYQGEPIGAIIQVISPNEKSRASVKLSTKYSFASLIGRSPQFLSALSKAQTAARSDLPVLIEGESGTGKELLAQSIHAAGYRATGPFIAVNCGAIPKELAASEFFGYEGGAFTGASKEGRAGKFELAHGGTIFLDEIGELPPDLQALMLRVLEEKEVVRLGGRTPIPVNIRIIAATNRRLYAEVEQGRFRRDLYYRLNVLSQYVPPLRERQGDIVLLLEHFLKKICNEIGRPPVKVDEEAMRVLQEYSWPGNVRELRNVAYRLAAGLTGDVVQTIHLPEEVLESRKETSEVKMDFSKTRSSRKNQEIQLIREVLHELNGNVSEAAARLGIHRSTIYRKLGRDLQD
ncbi:sigma-54-dependent Fis family transcriptional regulator [Paenibacillus hamazuiensis]|uniref:sigma-54-dependent Fis family transcriptional regulator n=1 Tax=Paenibacillus hamazuiensis TaxID=2936508 RepID=UPI002010BBC7|nr:sigma-54-dependent Fis family transcriptional regulator [Paenibacillus hamazuiensis]